MARYGGYYYGMPHKKYWEQRAKEQLAETFANSDEVVRYIEKIYESCLLDFCKEYNKVMYEFLTPDGEIIVDMLRLHLNTDAAFRHKVQRLNNQITMFSGELGQKSQERVLDLLKNTYKNNVIDTFEYFKKTPDGVVLLNDKAIEMAVRTPFTTDGREFSDRIWDNLDKMNARLRETLAKSIAEGRSIDKTVKQFRDIFGNTVYNTERIIRTETIACYAKASTDAYKALGVEELEVIVSSNACDECQALGEKPVKVSEAVVGLNIPPAHPFCRCAVAPIIKF